ncbi:Dabb family protein [Sinomonas soli]
MIKHLVMFQLAASDADQRQQDAARITEVLEGLADLSGVLDLAVHQDVGLDKHWDLVLVGSYSSAEALDAYQVNPRHVRAVEEIGPFVSARAIVDYEETAGAAR